MKKPRLLKTGSALALLLSMGLVAACDDGQVGGEPAVQQEQPPATGTAPGQPQPGTQTVPPEADERPGDVPPAEEPMTDEPLEEPDQGMEEEPAPPPQR